MTWVKTPFDFCAFCSIDFINILANLPKNKKVNSRLNKLNKRNQQLSTRLGLASYIENNWCIKIRKSCELSFIHYLNENEWISSISVSLFFVRNIITRLQIKIEKLKDDTCLASWFVLNLSLTRLQNTRTPISLFWLAMS